MAWFSDQHLPLPQCLSRCAADNMALNSPLSDDVQRPRRTAATVAVLFREKNSGCIATTLYRGGQYHRDQDDASPEFSISLEVHCCYQVLPPF
jgi:hypothetical protein